MNRLIVSVCERMLSLKTRKFSDDATMQLRVLRIFLHALLMLRKAEMIYIGTGPSYRSNETLSQIASALHSILALGVPGRRLLDEDTMFHQWFGRDGKVATQASSFARACDRACYQCSAAYIYFSDFIYLKFIFFLNFFYCFNC